MPAMVDQVIKAVATDDGAAWSGFVGKDVLQDQVVMLAVVLGHAALLVDRALLLITARVAEVAYYPRTGWEW